MLIKCSSCGAQAKLPDSKEGAKVKCPSCAHVYIARPIGARGAPNRSKDDTSKYILIGAIAVGVAVVAILFSGGNDDPVIQPIEEPEKKEVTAYVDPDGWDGPVLTLTRTLHQAAFAGNDTKLASLLDVEAAYHFVPVEETKGETIAPPPAPVEADGEGGGSEGDGEAAAPEAAPDEGPKPPFDSLSELEKIQFKNEVIAAAMAPGGDGPVSGWKPFDGSIKFSEEGIYVVRLNVVARDASADLPDRYTQWTLKETRGSGGAPSTWKWINVERWVTPEEAAASRRVRKPKAEKKKLSDGSVVYESKIRQVPFPEGTEVARAAELTKLVNDLVDDIDAPPRVRNPINEELVATGKEAIPALLSKMAIISETMSEDMEQNEADRIRLNWIHMCLEEITDFQSTFQVAVEMGGTKERIDSGIKQWYGWYDRKFKRFQVDDSEAVDPLLDDPDFQPQTPEEKRLYEKAVQEREMEKRKNGLK